MSGTFLGGIFYAVGLLFLVFDIFYLTKYNKISKISEWYKAFLKVSNRYPTASDTKNVTDLSLYQGIKVISTLEFIWLIFGILSGSWKVFITLMVIFYISNLLRIYMLGGFYTIPSKVLGFVTLLFKTAAIAMLVINHFHLHLDLFNIVRDVF